LEWQIIGGQTEKNKQKPWAPLLGEMEMKSIVEKAGFAIPESWSDVNRIRAGYLIRFYIVAIVIVMCGSLVAWINASILAIGIAFGLAVVIVLHGLVFQERFRFMLTMDGIWIRKGIWGTQRILLPWKNIQFQSLSQSIFQQKSNLMTLYLRTAAGSYSLPFIPANVARHISAEITFHLQTDQAKWG
jgi:membrane protein YdbS with pleckstrin-like domain